MIEILDYRDQNKKRPFADWFDGLAPMLAAKVTAALTRIEMGNMSAVKSLGGGVFEYRLHSGPGLRIYFGKDDASVVLLAGGTKRRQQADIAKAQDLWNEYQQRKTADEANEEERPVRKR